MKDSLPTYVPDAAMKIAHVQLCLNLLSNVETDNVVVAAVVKHTWGSPTTTRFCRTKDYMAEARSFNFWPRYDRNHRFFSRKCSSSNKTVCIYVFVALRIAKKRC